MNYWVLNIKVLDIIRVILFFVNFRKLYNLFEKPEHNKSLQSVIEKIYTLKQIYKNFTKIKENLQIIKIKKLKLQLS